MNKLQKEYDGSTTNAKACYSNLKCYGSGGRYRSIVPPTPVTVQPLEFNRLRPHSHTMSFIKLKNASKKQNNCINYLKFGGACWNKK